jgi:hypothetical protein
VWLPEASRVRYLSTALDWWFGFFFFFLKKNPPCVAAQKTKSMFWTGHVRKPSFELAGTRLTSSCPKVRL